MRGIWVSDAPSFVPENLLFDPWFIPENPLICA